MLTNIVEQTGVREWFNKTYKKRGLHYLRPKEAYYVFLEILSPTKHSSLLDVACGPGLLLKVADEYGLALTGIDISDVAIEMAQKAIPHADLQVANAEQLPYNNDQFDYITCIGSLERMLDLAKVLQEIRRVAKPDAQVCFMVRNSNRITWKVIKETLGLINKQGHQGANTLTNWTQIFEDAGFQVQATYPDMWPANRWLYWLSLGGRLFNPDFTFVKREDPYLDQAYEFIFHLRLY